jgi:hypothetical protein
VTTFHVVTPEQEAALADVGFDEILTGDNTPGLRQELAIHIKNETGTVLFSLFKEEGTDADLHLFDELGNHTGIDYSTGLVEKAIPRSWYSGEASKVQGIGTISPEEGIYVLRVVGRNGSGSFVVTKTETKTGGGAVVADVTEDVTTTFNSWTLDRASGALVSSITITNNSGKDGLPLEGVFWYAITESTNVRLATVSGYTNGMAYYDVTAQIVAQLPTIGNGDLKLDVGESVTFTVPIYSRDRSIPVGHVYSIWADPPAAAAIRPPKLKAWRSSGGALILAWPTSQAEYVLEESDSLSQPNWRVVLVSPLLQGQQNTVTVPVGSGTKFYRLKQK